MPCDDVINIEDKKPKQKKVVTLREVVEILKMKNRPDIMPRYVSIGNVVYDMAEKLDQEIVQKALYQIGLSFGGTVKKRNPAPVIPMIDQHERIKSVSRLRRNLAKAR